MMVNSGEWMMIIMVNYDGYNDGSIPSGKSKFVDPENIA